MYMYYCILYDDCIIHCITPAQVAFMHMHECYQRRQEHGAKTPKVTRTKLQDTSSEVC